MPLLIGVVSTIAVVWGTYSIYRGFVDSKKEEPQAVRPTQSPSPTPVDRHREIREAWSGGTTAEKYRFLCDILEINETMNSGVWDIAMMKFEELKPGTIELLSRSYNRQTRWFDKETRQLNKYIPVSPERNDSVSVPDQQFERTQLPPNPSMIRSLLGPIL